MAFKTFTAGSVLTASDVNTYLMRQAIITCTAATRPASPSEGMTVYQTDTNSFYTYDGSTWYLTDDYGPQWISYTPSISGTGWAKGDGTIVGYYQRLGSTIHFQATFTIGATTTKGAAGSSANALRISTPSATNGGVTTPIGFAYAADISTSTPYMLNFAVDTSGIVLLGALNGASGPTQGVYGTTPFTWATGDYIIIEGFYGAGVR